MATKDTMIAYNYSTLSLSRRAQQRRPLRRLLFDPMSDFAAFAALVARDDAFFQSAKHAPERQIPSESSVTASKTCLGGIIRRSVRRTQRRGHCRRRCGQSSFSQRLRDIPAVMSLSAKFTNWGERQCSHSADRTLQAQEEAAN